MPIILLNSFAEIVGLFNIVAIIVLNNPTISAKELSRIIGISQRKIEENIKKLKKKEIIKRIGPDKGGYWKVK